MKIIVDAGHGPNTPGKRSPDGRLREFHFNSAVADELKKRLLLDGHTVIFSHHPEEDVPLFERTRLANRLRADLFLSIHANAAGNSFNGAAGIETFIHPNASNFSRQTADAVQQSLVRSVKLPDRGVKREDFAVLRDTHMPAILIECGFMTNREELALLQSDHYRRRCAGAIAYAVNCCIPF